MPKHGEEWAKLCVERELLVPVLIHDDNTKDGMYDLRVGEVETPDLAIEVTIAAIGDHIATWKAGPANGPLRIGTKWSWNVSIVDDANIKQVSEQLKRWLPHLESISVSYVETHKWQTKHASPDLYNCFVSAGIRLAVAYDSPDPTRVWLNTPSVGGAVETSGDPTAKWIEEWVREPSRDDNLRKLRNSGADRRHLFVIVEMTAVTNSVWSYLTSEMHQLPTNDVRLPSELTGIWLISSFGQWGCRWEYGTWTRFAARGSRIDS